MNRNQKRAERMQKGTERAIITAGGRGIERESMPSA